MKQSRIGSSLFASAVCALLLACTSAAQTPQVLVDGQGTGPVGVSVGATAVLDVVGPATQAFALGIGFQPATIVTQSGTLGFDPQDPASFIFLDGFDPSHPNYAISFLSVLGQFTMFATPFQNGSSGNSFWTQALVMDPSHPEGIVLSNTVQVTSVQPPPTVTSTAPNYSAAGGMVYVNGSDFDQNPQNNVVMVGDHPCAVMNGGSDWIFSQLPMDARSGPMSVTTSAGTGGGNQNSVHTWCAVITTPYNEGNHPSLITDTTTVVGLIAAPGENDLYTMQVNAGEEIFVEVYSWDTNTQSITGTINSVNAFFDPTVRIIRNNVPVATDDDSGPHLNAGIGIYGGNNHFIADATGEYVIEVDAFLGLGTGWYMIVMGTRTPISAPLSVVSLHPNVARPGDTVQAYVSGVTGGDPSQYTLDVGGVQIPVTNALPGRLDFVVPWNAGVISGAVNISTATESTSHIDNDMQAWLCVITNNLIQESNYVAPLMPGDSLYGQLSNGIETDVYLFSAQAGASYFIEVSSFDDATGRVRTAGFLIPGPLDPELRIMDGGTVLASDGAGGPGLNALLGGTNTGPFVAPQTSWYTIQVSSLFGISWGSYILNIRQLSP